MPNDTNTNEIDIGDDLVITKNKANRFTGGRWVCGRMNGYKFEALVFPEHADQEEYEIGGNGANGSKISKLWIQRIADKTETYCWDRGLVNDAADATTQAIVGFLCAGLADHTYAE